MVKSFLFLKYFQKKETRKYAIVIQQIRTDLEDALERAESAEKSLKRYRHNFR